MRKQVEFLPRPGRIHYRACFLRYFRQTFTNPWVFVPILLEVPFMLLIVSFVYEDGTFYEPRWHNTAANCTVFLLPFAAGLMSLLGSYREICKEREILTREVFGGLNVISYLGAKISVLTLVGLVQSLLLSLGSLAVVDFNFARPALGFFAYFLALFLTNSSMAAIGLLVSALLKKSESAILPVLIIIVMQVVFAGALIQFDPPVRSLTFITPTMYGTSIIGSITGLGEAFPVEDRVVYSYNIWMSMFILLVFCFVCYVLTAIKLKYDYRTKD